MHTYHKIEEHLRAQHDQIVSKVRNNLKQLLESIVKVENNTKVASGCSKKELQGIVEKERKGEGYFIFLRGTFPREELVIIADSNHHHHELTQNFHILQENGLIDAQHDTSTYNGTNFRYFVSTIKLRLKNLFLLQNIFKDDPDTQKYLGKYIKKAKDFYEEDKKIIDLLIAYLNQVQFQDTDGILIVKDEEELKNLEKLFKKWGCFFNSNSDGKKIFFNLAFITQHDKFIREHFLDYLADLPRETGAPDFVDKVEKHLAELQKQFDLEKQNNLKETEEFFIKKNDDCLDLTLYSSGQDKLQGAFSTPYYQCQIAGLFDKQMKHWAQKQLSKLLGDELFSLYKTFSQQAESSIFTMPDEIIEKATLNELKEVGKDNKERVIRIRPCWQFGLFLYASRDLISEYNKLLGMAYDASGVIKLPITNLALLCLMEMHNRISEKEDPMLKKQILQKCAELIRAHKLIVPEPYQTILFDTKNNLFSSEEIIVLKEKYQQEREKQIKLRIEYMDEQDTLREKKSSTEPKTEEEDDDAPVFVSKDPASRWR